MLSRPRMFPNPFRSGDRLVLGLMVEVPGVIAGRQRLRRNLLARTIRPHDDEVPVCASATAGVTVMTAARPIEAMVLSMVFLRAGPTGGRWLKRNPVDHSDMPLI